MRTDVRVNIEISGYNGVVNAWMINYSYVGESLHRMKYGITLIFFLLKVRT